MVTEILDRFADMNADIASKCFVIYQNFVSLTNVIRHKAGLIMQEFGFSVKLPNYYTPDASLVETLRQCVEQKKRGGQSNLAKVSQ